MFHSIRALANFGWSLVLVFLCYDIDGNGKIVASSFGFLWGMFFLSNTLVMFSLIDVELVFSILACFTIYMFIATLAVISIPFVIIFLLCRDIIPK